MMSFDFNCKLKGCEVLKESPLEIVKLYKEIETLKDKLGKFVGCHEAFNKIIKVQRHPKDKFDHGFWVGILCLRLSIYICDFVSEERGKRERWWKLPTRGDVEGSMMMVRMNDEIRKKKRNFFILKKIKMYKKKYPLNKFSFFKLSYPTNLLL